MMILLSTLSKFVGWFPTALVSFSLFTCSLQCPLRGVRRLTSSSASLPRRPGRSVTLDAPSASVILDRRRSCPRSDCTQGGNNDTSSLDGSFDQRID